MTNALPLPCTPVPVIAAAPQGARGTLIAATVASSLAFVLGSMVNVALPQMQADFGTGPSGAQWIVNAYLLPLGALVLMGGALGDHFGRKRVFQAGLGVFAASCLLAAVAWSFPILLFARVLEGLGAAMIAPTSLAILAEAFSGSDRGRAVGTWAGAGAAAGAVAPVAGGWIVDVAGWRWAFIAVLPFAALAYVIARRSIRESVADVNARAPLDWLGATLVSGGLLAAVWGLIALPDTGTSGTTIPALILGAALLTGFVVVEGRKGDAAMIPLVLFRDAGFSGLTLFTFFLYAALGGLMLLLPYTLISGLGYAASAAGLAILPMPLIIGAMSRFSGGALVDRFGTRNLLAGGATLVTVGFLLLSQLPADATYLPDILPGLLSLSVGMAMAVAPLTSAVLSSAGAARSGTASGVNNAVSRIGGLVATALLGLVLSGDLLAGFAVAAWAGAALAGLSVAVALRLPDGGNEKPPDT